MGGGGGTQKSTVTQNTSNIPEWMAPYVTQMLDKGQAYSMGDQGYQAYPGERVAGQDPLQKQAQQGVTGMQQPGGFQQGADLAGRAGEASMTGGGYKPATFTNQNVSNQNVNTALNNYDTSSITDYQMQGPDKFGQQQADQYMSPYMQNVVDVQKQQALRDAKQGQLAQGLGAARSGTYGGARQAIASTERERNLGDLQNKIQVQGSQAAYENAQQQFERDRAAGMTTAQANQKASLDAQNLRQNTGLQAILANQQAQNNMGQFNASQNMDAQKANQQYDMLRQQYTDEASRAGAGLNLQGYAQAADAGKTVAGIGQAQQTSDLERYNAMNQMGQQNQQQEQQRLNYDYGDFREQRDWAMNNLGQFSSLIHGLPWQPDQTTTSYQAPPSLAGQIAGTGLSAAGLYNMYNQGAK